MGVLGRLHTTIDRLVALLTRRPTDEGLGRRNVHLETRIEEGTISHGGVRWEYTYGKTPPPRELAATLEGPYCLECDNRLWRERKHRRFRQDCSVWACYECDEQVRRTETAVATEKTHVESTLIEETLEDNGRLEEVLYNH